jgi:general secretion pathway protein G
MIKTKGFSVIELLVVVAILSVVMSIVMSSIGKARDRAQDTKRKQDMLAIQNALELYFFDYGAYPTTYGNWYGMSELSGNRPASGTEAYIPGLTPDYMAVLPVDPSGNTSGWSGYLYVSDGSNYKLLSHYIGPKSFPASGQKFYDPVRPTWALMLCSDEPACSSW